MKGQVWIGSGFGDDNLHQGAVTAAEGELGCSDVPGWAESYAKTGAAAAELKKSTDGKTAKAAVKPKPKSQKRANDEDGPFDEQPAPPEESSHGKNGEAKPSADDGTDDYVQHT